LGVHQKEGEPMKYEMKLRLNARQYLAVLDKALVIVTENEKGEPIRYAIFGLKTEKKEKSNE